MKFAETNLQALAARVEKLEAQNRRWKLAGGLAALFGASFLLMGAKPADRIEPPTVRASTVEAQEFILKDENGHVYARLSLSPSAPAMKQQNGRTYLIPTDLIPAGQAALQFYSDKGEVVWTAPTSPTYVPVK